MFYWLHNIKLTISNEQKFTFYPMIMGPRIDKNLVMQDPSLLMKEGRFKKVDIMLGSTQDEGAAVTLG